MNEDRDFDEILDEPAAPDAKQAQATGKIGAAAKTVIQSSSQFVRDFVPPDYLIYGVLQRRFSYSLTARTGDGKTAILLFISACTALGQNIGEYEVEQGRVLYFAGENPDDLRMRWLAMSEQMGFDVDVIDVYFIPGSFKISEMMARIEAEAKMLGGIILVVVDTSAAYFEGRDDNSNVEAGAHARRLRGLADLPGGPCVITACHPVKNATEGNLIPRGGGAFVAEMDGNLTCVKNGTTVELHWQGKFRGPDFTPLTFVLRSTTHQKLKDSKGRQIATVVASHLSEIGAQELAATARGKENVLLKVIAQNENASFAELARTAGWFMKDGRPYKSLVQRTIASLKAHKLVQVERDSIFLTEKGHKALSKAKATAALNSHAYTDD
jgi:hypothetical protein